jgi:peroxiredoxin
MFTATLHGCADDNSPFCEILYFTVKASEELAGVRSSCFAIIIFIDGQLFPFVSESSLDTNESH